MLQDFAAHRRPLPGRRDDAAVGTGYCPGEHAGVGFAQEA
jgi:hypothetical protein